jgi:phage-related minor tail protein
MRIEDWNSGAVDGSLHGWEGEGSFAFGSLEELRASILETETAYTRFAGSALNENELIDASLSTVASGLSNTIASALASGKLDFASFARSAAASLAQIITQQLIIRSLAAFGFGAADGAVVPGGVETFARGGIVSKPTLFAMGGGGVGLMGEESAEAIMPLRRDKSGRLGVSASGAGTSGAGGIVINVVNNAENSPNNDARMARAIGQQVRAAWNAEARRQMQAGGTLNPIGAGV